MRRNPLRLIDENPIYQYEVLRIRHRAERNNTPCIDPALILVRPLHTISLYGFMTALFGIGSVILVLYCTFSSLYWTAREQQPEDITHTPFSPTSALFGRAMAYFSLGTRILFPILFIALPTVMVSVFLCSVKVFSIFPLEIGTGKVLGGYITIEDIGIGLLVAIVAGFHLLIGWIDMLVLLLLGCIGGTALGIWSGSSVSKRIRAAFVLNILLLAGITFTFLGFFGQFLVQQEVPRWLMVVPFAEAIILTPAFFILGMRFYRF